MFLLSRRQGLWRLVEERGQAPGGGMGSCQRWLRARGLKEEFLSPAPVTSNSPLWKPRCIRPTGHGVLANADLLRDL